MWGVGLFEVHIFIGCEAVSLSEKPSSDTNSVMSKQKLRYAWFSMYELELSYILHLRWVWFRFNDWIGVIQGRQIAVDTVASVSNPSLYRSH